MRDTVILLFGQTIQMFLVLLIAPGIARLNRSETLDRNAGIYRNKSI